MPRTLLRVSRYQVPVTGFSVAVLAPAGLRQAHLTAAPVATGEAFAEQAAEILRDLEVTLRTSGGSSADVVRITIRLVHIADYAALHTLLIDFFGEPQPASTCVQVAALADGRLIEMDIVAVLS